MSPVEPRSALPPLPTVFDRLSPFSRAGPRRKITLIQRLGAPTVFKSAKNGENGRKRWKTATKPPVVQTEAPKARSGGTFSHQSAANRRKKVPPLRLASLGSGRDDGWSYANHVLTPIAAQRLVKRTEKIVGLRAGLRADGAR